MYDKEDNNEIDYDKLEQSFRNAVLNKKGKTGRTGAKKKVKFNPAPLTIMIISAMVIVAVIAAINSKPKVLYVNNKLADNVVVQDIVEDGTKSKSSAAIEQKGNQEVDEIKAEEEIKTNVKTETAVKTSAAEEKTKKAEKVVEKKTAQETVIVGKSKIPDTTTAAISQSIPEELVEKMPKSKAYTIQVAAGKDMDGALKISNELIKSGYPAACVKEGRFFKVLVGNFPTREKASEYGNKLLDKRAIKYFYPRYKN